MGVREEITCNNRVINSSRIIHVIKFTVGSSDLERNRFVIINFVVHAWIGNTHNIMLLSIIRVMIPFCI